MNPTMIPPATGTSTIHQPRWFPTGAVRTGENWPKKLMPVIRPISATSIFATNAVTIAEKDAQERNIENAAVDERALRNGTSAALKGGAEGRRHRQGIGGAGLLDWMIVIVVIGHCD